MMKPRLADTRTDTHAGFNLCGVKKGMKLERGQKAPTGLLVSQLSSRHRRGLRGDGS